MEIKRFLLTCTLRWVKTPYRDSIRRTLTNYNYVCMYDVCIINKCKMYTNILYGADRTQTDSSPRRAIIVDTTMRIS